MFRFFPVMSLIFLLLASLLSSLGCSSGNQEQKEQSANRQSAFYSLENLFVTEALRLASYPSVSRTVVLNGKSERQTIDKAQIDWEKELRPFIYSDINRAGWSDRYAGDTLLDDRGQLMEIHYQALDDRLRVRDIHISFEPYERQVTKVEVFKTRNSLIIDNEQQLTYIPATGYVLVNRQSTPISGEQELIVEVEWGR